MVSCDSDWAGDTEFFYSRGGCLIEAWGGLVSWSSFKIKSVMASSLESEYAAASTAVRQALWFRHLLADMGYGNIEGVQVWGKLCDDDYKTGVLSKLVDPQEKPMRLTVCCDNKGAIAVGNAQLLHNRTKHINVRHHLVKQEIARGHIGMMYINTKFNKADLLTKTFVRARHRELANMLLEIKVGNKFVDFEGRELQHEERAPRRMRLYATYNIVGQTSWKTFESNKQMTANYRSAGD